MAARRARHSARAGEGRGVSISGGGPSRCLIATMDGAADWLAPVTLPDTAGKEFDLYVNNA